MLVGPLVEVFDFCFVQCLVAVVVFLSVVVCDVWRVVAVVVCGGCCGGGDCCDGGVSVGEGCLAGSGSSELDDELLDSEDEDDDAELDLRVPAGVFSVDAGAFSHRQTRFGMSQPIKTLVSDTK